METCVFEIEPAGLCVGEQALDDPALSIPRHQSGTLDSALIGKHLRRFPGFDEKIISMYTQGMRTREITRHLRELYGIEVSADLISTVTDGDCQKFRTQRGRDYQASIAFAKRSPKMMAAYFSPQGPVSSAATQTFTTVAAPAGRRSGCHRPDNPVHRRPAHHGQDAIPQPRSPQACQSRHGPLSGHRPWHSTPE